MPTVTAIIVAYNSKQHLRASVTALEGQTRRPDTVVVIFCGNADQGKELVEAEFPNVQVVDPHANLGFAGGNNLAIRSFPADYYLLNNPDLIPEKDYLERLLPAMQDATVGAVTGKLYQYDTAASRRTQVLDTTGAVMRASGRPYDRGQGKVDAGQYDTKTDVWGFSGASVLLRASALEVVKAPKKSSQNAVARSQSEKDTAPTHEDRLLTTESEYFDETFHTYWEDTDLSWRMRRAGFRTVFVPGAVAHHGREIRSVTPHTASLVAYLRHYYSIAPFIRRNIVANYLFTVIKNAPRLSWPLLRRVVLVTGFVVIGDVRSWPALIRVLRHTPEMLQKRRMLPFIPL